MAKNNPSIKRSNPKAEIKSFIEIGLRSFSYSCFAKKLKEITVR